MPGGTPGHAASLPADGRLGPARCDIRTAEVLDWAGLHGPRRPISSCSQTLRIFPAPKGLAWRSRVIGRPARQNSDAGSLGIDPRGLSAGAGA